jgi:phosphonate transport system ATP-binding protein
MIGIIGRSGAGKSTLLRMLNRLTDADRRHGSPSRAKTSLALKGAAKAQLAVGLRHDLPAVQPRAAHGCRVQRAARHAEPPLDAGRRCSTCTRSADIHKAIEILDRLGIAEQAPPKRAEALSGGQQQRVAIARALMQDPKIILADEPIASLDPMNAQTVMESLRTIHEEDGRMVIANLHTLDTARRYCDRVIGMRDGASCSTARPSN